MPHGGLIFELNHLGYPSVLILPLSQGIPRQIWSAPCKIVAGVSQGYVLSPILLNTFFHEILTERNVVTAQYENDIALISLRRAILHYGTYI